MTVVGTVGTVAEVPGAARALDPDVTVMDYALPDGTGVTATERLLVERPGSNVVMLTGNSSGATLAAALEAGCCGFVSKEGRFGNLVHAIRAAANGEIAVPQELVDELTSHLRRRPPTLGDDLTARELEILGLLAGGASTEDMVRELGLSVHTVRNHIRNVLMKLQCRSRLEAVVVATRLGLCSSAAGVGRAQTR